MSSMAVRSSSANSSTWITRSLSEETVHAAQDCRGMTFNVDLDEGAHLLARDGAVERYDSHGLPEREALGVATLEPWIEARDRRRGDWRRRWREVVEIPPYRLERDDLRHKRSRPSGIV